MAVWTVSRSTLKAQPITFRSHKSTTTVRYIHPPETRTYVMADPIGV
jgi:hypothetical protein